MPLSTDLNCKDILSFDVKYIKPVRGKMGSSSQYSANISNFASKKFIQDVTTLYVWENS